MVAKKAYLAHDLRITQIESKLMHRSKIEIIDLFLAPIMLGQKCDIMVWLNFYVSAGAVHYCKLGLALGFCHAVYSLAVCLLSRLFRGLSLISYGDRWS